MAKTKTKAQKQKIRELRKKKRKLQQQKSFTTKSVKKTTVKSFTANAIKKIQDKQDWHQKTTIKTGIFKTKEITFFNFYKWLDTCFVDVNTGKNTANMSYAVVECFVNMVSEFKYDDMERFNKITVMGRVGLEEQCKKKKYTVESLQIILSNMIEMTGSYGTQDNEFVQYFMQLRHKIKCKKLKFCFLTRIYQGDSRWVDFEELKELRTGISFAEMVLITNRNSNYFETEKYERYLQSWINDIEKLQEEQGYISVYRSFRVNRGEKIRQGLTRECKTMEGGKGNSFSFRKTISLRVNAFINTYMISKYLELTGKKNSDTMAKSVLQGSYMNKGILNAFDSDDRVKDMFGVLAEFRIKKEDIVVFSDTLGELEVIMDYKKAKLEDYTFTNIIHFFATVVAKSLFENTNTSLKGEQIIDNYYGNCEQIFDIAYWYTSKYFKQNKTELKLCVRNGNLDKKALVGILDSILEDNFETDAQSCSIFYGELEDDNCIQMMGFSGNDKELFGTQSLKEYNLAKITGVRQTKNFTRLWSEL